LLYRKGQVLAIYNACGKIATGAQAATVGDGVITISKYIRDIIVISVKYDVKSMVGATVQVDTSKTAQIILFARLGHYKTQSYH